MVTTAGCDELALCVSSSSIEWACTPFAKAAHSGRSGALATTAVSAGPSSAPTAASIRATASAVSTVPPRVAQPRWSSNSSLAYATVGASMSEKRRSVTQAASVSEAVGALTA